MLIVWWGRSSDDAVEEVVALQFIVINSHSAMKQLGEVRERDRTLAMQISAATERTRKDSEEVERLQRERDKLQLALTEIKQTMDEEDHFADVDCGSETGEGRAPGAGSRAAASRGATQAEATASRWQRTQRQQEEKEAAAQQQNEAAPTGAPPMFSAAAWAAQKKAQHT